MKKHLIITIALINLLNPFPAPAQDKISVAVAANFISAFTEIAADFEAKTKIKVEGTFSSTGNLYSQIKNGAPMICYFPPMTGDPLFCIKRD